MKIIVAHSSPDLDAITSVWLLRKFLSGWENAEVRFVSAGDRIAPFDHTKTDGAVEHIGENEVIHVDTGLGPLDHHQTNDEAVCAASLTWDYVRERISGGEKWEEKQEALSRLVKVVVDIDHFKEVFWPDPTADHYEFSLFGILEGLKMQRPDEDDYYVTFISECLDALLHNFENRVWAEKELKEKGKEFQSRYGKGIGFESVNDTVLKLAQKMGYAIAVRKDPRKGYVRIKAKPALGVQPKDIDLTLVYEKLSKMDPDATWFLHVSKKMLLNGTTKNPKMRPTRLSLDDIIRVLENV
ncbi:MAG: hypothetical protein HYT10_02195 [Candidatus Levybacteria bacterium]|nr:hypothetical protein [Candidatus Levybacteria bacterium]